VETKKVVINNCYGGFGISEHGLKWLHEHGSKFVTGEPLDSFRDEYPMLAFYNLSRFESIGDDYFIFSGMSIMKGYYIVKDDIVFSIDHYNIPRHDDLLVRMVEELEKKANNMCSNLKIVEIPADVEYSIQDYDGHEWVAEEHRTWS
jgi:hypothetical protein